MYFGLFWFSWKNFSIRENEHPSSIKEKMGGGGWKGRATPPSYLEPRLPDVNRKLLFVLCFVPFMYGVTRIINS